MQNSQRRYRTASVWQLAKTTVVPTILLGLVWSTDLTLAVPKALAMTKLRLAEGNHSTPVQLAIRKGQPPNPAHKLRLHNLCSQTVDLVIRYQNPAQQWVTQRAVSLPAKKSQYFRASASSPVENVSSKVLYYYATSPDSDLVWSGSGHHRYLFEQQVLDMRIHYAGIDVLNDYSLFILCA